MGAWLEHELAAVDVAATVPWFQRCFLGSPILKAWAAWAMLTS